MHGSIFRRHPFRQALEEQFGAVVAAIGSWSATGHHQYGQASVYNGIDEVDGSLRRYSEASVNTQGY